MGASPGKLPGSAYGLTVAYALRKNQEHPELVFRKDALLRSINDRLGALCAHFDAPAAGHTVPKLTGEYLEEIMILAAAEADDADDGPGTDDEYREE